MGKHKKFKNISKRKKIPKNRDIEEVVYNEKENTKKEQPTDSEDIKNKETNYKESLRVRNYCIRKEAQQTEIENKEKLLKIISKLQEQDEER